jgi:hypothetical protein
VSAEPCTSYAPGRSLPINECERCGWQRHEHLEKHQSLPTAQTLRHVVPLPPTPHSAPVVESEKVLYCRQCGAGLIIKPPHDPNTWPCPKCGHVGPRSGHPAVPMPDEKEKQSAALSLQLPPFLAAIKLEHERQAKELDLELQVLDDPPRHTDVGGTIAKEAVPLSDEGE